MMMFDPSPSTCVLDLLLRAAAEGHQHHDGGDADDDAEHRQRAAQPVGAQGAEGDPEGLAGPHGAPVASRLDQPVAHVRSGGRRSAATSGSWVTTTTATPRSDVELGRAGAITSAPLRGVEVAGGLVGQQQRRLADQRPGDRDPLLLTAGQLAGPVARAGARDRPTPAPPRPARAARPAVPRGRPAAARRCPARLVRPSSWKDWKTKPIVRLRSSASSRVGQRRHVATADPQHAGRRPVEAAQQVHQRRLAASRTARRRRRTRPGRCAGSRRAAPRPTPRRAVAAPYVDRLDRRGGVGHGTSSAVADPVGAAHDDLLARPTAPRPPRPGSRPGRRAGPAARGRVPFATTHTASRRPSRNTAAAGTATASRAVRTLQVDDGAHPRSRRRRGAAVGKAARGRATAARRRSRRRGWTCVGVGSTVVTVGRVRRVGHRVQLGGGRDARADQQYVGLVDLRGQGQRRTRRSR